MNFTALSATTRAVFLVSGLALGLAIAVPAYADNVQFGFSFSLGNGGYIGRHFAPSAAPQPVCMGEDQMRSQLRAQGYRWIAFGPTARGWAHVSAKRLGQSYQFDMNTCTGTLANLQAATNWGSADWGSSGAGYPRLRMPGPAYPGAGTPGTGFGGVPVPGFGFSR